ncbi:MAG: YXWGXW repeat-containing protein [Steroidobacteraceae bacterium]
MHIRFLRGLFPALVLAALPAVSSAALFVGVSVDIAPPALPVYVQPPCPEPGYLWSPGYWAWDEGAYYWVPGTWVLPPQVGFLWTPGYWGWNDGGYFWHAGYWGPHVGFYGGVNYGFGYDGVGFDGGYWRGRSFMYNRAVVHVGPTFVTNVYSRPVEYRGGHAHVSFNGGPGGVVAHASRAQMAAAHDHHVAFTSVQQRQQRMAFADRSLRADNNHGRPPIAATARATVFHGGATYAARAAGGHYTPSHSAPAMRSDRPPGATGQGHAGFERAQPQHFQEQRRAQAQRRFSQQRPAEQRHFQPQQHAEQHFQPQQRAEQHFQQRSQARPSFRPEGHPQGRRQARPAPPRPQQHAGDRHPPENRGHNR